MKGFPLGESSREIIPRYVTCDLDLFAVRLLIPTRANVATWLKEDINTSRAARGGGGSFKNIKPIGKIRCCESEMSDQKH